MLPNEDATDQGTEFLSLYGLSGILILPLYIDRRIIGSLSLESFTPLPHWSPDQLLFFQMVADLFTTTLNRILVEEELRNRIDTYEILFKSYSDGYFFDQGGPSGPSLCALCFRKII